MFLFVWVCCEKILGGVFGAYHTFSVAGSSANENIHYRRHTLVGGVGFKV